MEWKTTAGSNVKGTGTKNRKAKKRKGEWR